MVIVMGASLVTQPTFIFGENSAAIHYKQYTLGALIVIFCAMMGGLFPVLMSKCKEVPSCFYMAVGGAGVLTDPNTFEIFISSPKDFELVKKLYASHSNIQHCFILKIDSVCIQLK